MRADGLQEADEQREGGGEGGGAGSGKRRHMFMKSKVLKRFSGVMGKALFHFVDALCSHLSWLLLNSLSHTDTHTN